MMTNPQR